MEQRNCGIHFFYINGTYVCTFKHPVETNYDQIKDFSFCSLLIAEIFLTIFYTLEIKPCRLGSRIRDMEAESHN